MNVVIVMKRCIEALVYPSSREERHKASSNERDTRLHDKSHDI